MNHVWRSTVASLLIALQAGTSFGRVYVVKSGDTLSQVVKRELGNPVYGKKGNLQQVLQWNPDITDADRIAPAQNIKLGPDEIEAPAAVASTPEPEATPAPAPVADAVAPETTAADAPVPNPWAKARFGLDIDALLGRTTLDVTSEDKQYTSSPHSRLNRGVQLRAYYLLTPESALGVQISALQSEFAESRDGRLQGVEKNLKAVSLFYHQVLAQRFHLELGLGTEQSYFLSRTDQATFELDPIFVDFLKLTLGYDLLATENWLWNLAALGKLNRAADGPSADAESGHSYGARTGLAYRLNDELYLNAGIQFERRVQDSTEARQRNDDALANLGLTLLF